MVISAVQVVLIRKLILHTDYADLIVFSFAQTNRKLHVNRNRRFGIEDRSRKALRLQRSNVPIYLVLFSIR